MLLVTDASFLLLHSPPLWDLQVLLPVIVYESNLLPIGRGETVLWSLAPLNVINAVRAIVIAGNDNVAKQLLGTLILEVLSGLLVDCLPSWRRGDKNLSKVRVQPPSHIRSKYSLKTHRSCTSEPCFKK